LRRESPFQTCIDWEAKVEIKTLGAVRVPARLESLEDVMRLRRGEIGAEAVRTVTVPDALVDTGAVMLSLPRRIVQQLGCARSGRGGHERSPG
jgi:hypothetical protein